MAAVPGEQACSTCNAWIALPGDPTHGRCQAHPPLPMFGAHAKQPGPGVPELEFYFPITAELDWCREWQNNPGGPPS